jgi:hypothetical protein
VLQKQHDEQNAAQQTVGVQEGQEIAVIDPVGIEGNPLEDIGEGHAEQQGRPETADEDAGLPEALPARVIALGSGIRSPPRAGSG